MAVCGTPAGYHAHYMAKEEACDACKRAISEDTKQKRLRLPKQAEPIRSGGNFEKSGIVIVRVDRGEDDASPTAGRECRALVSAAGPDDTGPTAA